jgi:hypothetical protein
MILSRQLGWLLKKEWSFYKSNWDNENSKIKRTRLSGE